MKITILQNCNYPDFKCKFRAEVEYSAAMVGWLKQRKINFMVTGG